MGRVDGGDREVQSVKGRSRGWIERGRKRVILTRLINVVDKLGRAIVVAFIGHMR